MKRLNFFALTILVLAIGACSQQKQESVESITSTPASSQPSSSSKSSVSEGPKKSVEITSISLTTQSSKAYIIVRGTQTNYTQDDFKWAWGIKEQNGGFVDGKESPASSDFKPATFNDNNEFNLEYCLTDIETLVSGTLYRIYGGTPESYGDIAFASNNFGARDATRSYYLRSDENNSLVFDNIQPISFTKASVVEIGESDLPDGITNPGAYVKFGGENTANLTVETINSWNQANKIAGNFQRVIGDGYSVHNHIDEERFWTIEDNYVYFYCYIGFIAEGEGWMTHFDLVSGNGNANFQLATTLKGETPYIVDGKMFKVYADTNAQGEENYWGCLGIYCQELN